LRPGRKDRMGKREPHKKQSEKGPAWEGGHPVDGGSELWDVLCWTWFIWAREAQSLRGEVITWSRRHHKKTGLLKGAAGLRQYGSRPNFGIGNQKGPLDAKRTKTDKS